MAGFLFGEIGLFGWERWGAHCKNEADEVEAERNEANTKESEEITVCDGLVWVFLRDGVGLYDMKRSGIWYKCVGKCDGFGIGAGYLCAIQREGARKGKCGGERPTVRRTATGRKCAPIEWRC